MISDARSFISKKFFFLSYLILSYLILSYLILSYLILSYLILSYLILSYLKKQIAFPIDLSPGLDLCRFGIIRRYAVPKD
jgi:hypothetical protein